MEIIKGFFKGIDCYRKANKVIIQYKLWPYLSIPGILSLIYISIIIGIGFAYTRDLSVYIYGSWIPGFLQFEFITSVIVFMLWILLIIIGILTYKFVILILFSPVLAYLSETVEKVMLNREPPPFDFKGIIKDIFRGLNITLRNSVKMIFFLFIIWLISLIPVVGLISPFLILFVQSFYEGCSLMDYTLERKRFSVQKSLNFAKNHRGKVTGVGSGFMLFFLIPFFGWFLAPGYGTVAATIFALEELNEG